MSIEIDQNQVITCSGSSGAIKKGNVICLARSLRIQSQLSLEFL
jgi:hypothetical protein